MQYGTDSKMSERILNLDSTDYSLTMQLILYFFKNTPQKPSYFLDNPHLNYKVILFPFVQNALC